MAQSPPGNSYNRSGVGTALINGPTEITALERCLNKTRTIKQGMMQQLLTGSIRLPIPATSAEREADP